LRDVADDEGWGDVADFCFRHNATPRWPAVGARGRPVEILKPRSISNLLKGQELARLGRGLWGML
jgi:hypothetical protein